VAARIWMTASVTSPTLPLGLVPATPSERGRARRLAERLQSLGVAHAVVDEGVTTSPLVVSAWPADGRTRNDSAAGAGPCALVHSGEDPQRVGIDQRLVRLDEARRLQAPPSGVGTGPAESPGAQK
jgi:hypothetical protein